MIETVPVLAGNPAGSLVDSIVAMRQQLGELAELSGSVDGRVQIDLIAELERLRAAAAAAQARVSTAFAAAQVTAHAAAGVPKRRWGGGVAEQIGYARRISPVTAARDLGFATDLQTDLPAVFDALRAGRVSEWVAKLVVRETRELPRETRQRIAAELVPDLSEMGPRQAAAAARRMAYEADPRAVLARSRTARSDRHVSIRPEPDTMVRLSAFLPVEQGIAAYASLDRHAKSQRAAGDSRTRGQLMADTLVERVTGQAAAPAVPIEIGITMTADTLLDALQPDAWRADQTPAYLDGYGPIPADLALDLAANAHTVRPTLEGVAPEVVAAPVLDVAVDVWVRRLFTDPIDDTIAHIDTKRRRFDGALARLLRYRDQCCRETYCTAPIRHLDHVQSHRDGGPTTAVNGAGLCERGNYVKEMPGWEYRVLPGSTTQRIEVCTPTGHTYISAPPPALGPGGNYRQRRRRRRDRQRRAHAIIRPPPPRSAEELQR